VIAVTAFVALAIFVGVFDRLGIVAVARHAAAVAHGSALAVRDAADDRARERLSQDAARQLASAAASILTRSAAAIGAAALMVWAADRFGAAPADDVIVFLSGWRAAAAALVLSSLIYLLGRRRWLTR
jgi:hypothetical protein